MPRASGGTNASGPAAPSRAVLDGRAAESRSPRSSGAAVTTTGRSSPRPLSSGAGDVPATAAESPAHASAPTAKTTARSARSHRRWWTRREPGFAPGARGSTSAATVPWPRPRTRRSPPFPRASRTGDAQAVPAARVGVLAKARTARRARVADDQLDAIAAADALERDLAAAVLERVGDQVVERLRDADRVDVGDARRRTASGPRSAGPRRGARRASAPRRRSRASVPRPGAGATRSAPPFTSRSRSRSAASASSSGSGRRRGRAASPPAPGPGAGGGARGGAR